MEAWQLRQMQSLPLEQKIIMSQRRITDWYNYYDGQVYISFSGGKDSTVLLHILRDIFPDVPALFVDTGLEFPEIRQFARSFENIIVKRPKINFRDVIQIYGYPIVSKDVAKVIKEARRYEIASGKYGSSLQKINGTLKNKDGTLSQFNCSNWAYLMNAPFKISDECCNVMKKKPAHEFSKETGRMPILGTMASESRLREQQWIENGCNGFFMRSPVSNPLAFWMEQDVLQYIRRYQIPYASVYGDIVEGGRGRLMTTGYARTGCMFCAFGAHLEKGETRFQRMSRTHPKQHDYCMRPIAAGGLDMAMVLDFIHVPYEIRQTNLF